MLPKYDVGKILYELMSRVEKLETATEGYFKKIVADNITISNNLKMDYADIYTVPFIDALHNVDGRPLSTLIYGSDNQVIVSDIGTGEIQLKLPQEIGTQSIVTLGGLYINGSNRIAPISYTLSPIYTFEMIGENVNETMLNIRRSDNSNIGSGILLQKSRGIPMSPQRVLNGDALGLIYFSGHDGNDWDTPLLIYGQATENHTPASIGAQMNFQTTANGSSELVTRLTIDHDGTIIARSTQNTILSNTSSGSLIVKGGTSIAGNLYVGGLMFIPSIAVSGTTESTDPHTGSLVLEGGLGIEKSLHVGNIAKIHSTISASDSQTGAFMVVGGAGIGENLHVGGEIFAYSTEDSSSTSTGALVIFGGTGIGKTLCVGENVKIFGTTLSTDVSSGALQVIGGIGAEQLYIASSSEFGGAMQVNNTITTNDVIRSTSTVNASDSQTGALQIVGGAGLGQLYVDRTSVFNGQVTADNVIILTNTTNSTSTTTGSLQVHGGAGIEQLYVSNTSSFYGPMEVYNTVTTNDIIKTTSLIDASGALSGALQVVGGGSVGGNFYISGLLDVNGSQTFNGPTQAYDTVTIWNSSTSTSTDSGALRIVGGAGLGQLYVDGSSVFNGLINVINTTNATDILSGSLVTSGGVGISKDLYVGGTIYGNLSGNIVADTIGIPSTINSTSTNTGALTVAGGVGIGKDVYIGGVTYITNTTDSTDTTTGSLIISGGVVINKNLHANTITCVDKLTVGGLIDPTGLQLTQVAGNPGTNDTIWRDVSSRTRIGSGLLPQFVTLPTITPDGVLCFTGDTTGNLAAPNVTISSAGIMTIPTTTNATDTTTGTLIIGGGIGIAKEIHSNGIYSDNSVIQGKYINGGTWYKIYSITTNTTDSFEMTIITKSANDGYVNKMIFHVAVLASAIYPTYSIESSTTVNQSNVSIFTSISGIYDIYVHGNNLTDRIFISSSSAQNALLWLNDGTGVYPAGYPSGGAVFDTNIDLPNEHKEYGTFKLCGSSDSTSTTTGSLVVTGGVGIAESMFVGTKLLSASGQIIGKYVSASDAWYKVYNIVANSGDALNMTVISKNTALCVPYELASKTIQIATGTSSCPIIVKHSIDSSYLAAQVRICCFDTTVGTSDFIETQQTGITSSKTYDMSIISAFQIFTCITGRQISKIDWWFTPATVTSSPLVVRVDMYKGSGTIGKTLLGSSSSVSLASALPSGAWYTFTFASPISATTNDVFTAKITRVSGAGTITFDYNAADVFSMGDGGRVQGGADVFLGFDWVFKIYTTSTSLSSYDVYIKTRPEIGSAIEVIVNNCANQPIWTLDGTGTWPTSYPSGTGIRFDSDSSLYPPNISRELGRIILHDTTNSTSDQKGAFYTKGGMTVDKDMYVGGIENVLNTIGASSTSTGSVIVAGGVSIAKDLYVGGTIHGTIPSNFDSLALTSTTQSTSVNTGALTVAGGAGIGKNMYVGGTLRVTGVTTLDNTLSMGNHGITSVGIITASDTIKTTNTTAATYTSTNVGALQVAGGATIGNMVITNTTGATGTSTGALVVLGGVAISKNINILGMANAFAFTAQDANYFHGRNGVSSSDIDKWVATATTNDAATQTFWRHGTYVYTGAHFVTFDVCVFNSVAILMSSIKAYFSYTTDGSTATIQDSTVTFIENGLGLPSSCIYALPYGGYPATGDVIVYVTGLAGVTLRWGGDVNDITA